jgi:hypothetical protein
MMMFEMGMGWDTNGIIDTGLGWEDREAFLRR